MRPLLASVFALAACASAEYFSEGWKPGQPTNAIEAPLATYTPAQEPATSNTSPFDLTNILTTGAVGELLAKVGVNLTQTLNATRVLEDIWDLRLPLIHDDNWEELVVHEQFSSKEEEERRLWFLIITSTAGQQQQGGISKLVDREFDKAFNKSLLAGDLPDVKWGRIDYLNVTYLTTKWNIWQAPWLVVVKDRGQTLRFYRANQVRLTADIIRDFIKEGNWEYMEPWSGPWAPGGKREFVMHYWALVNRKFYDVLVRVPRFVLMIVMGGAASLIMRLMHRNGPTPTEKQPLPKERPVRKPIPVRREGVPSSGASDAGSTTSTPKKGGSLRGRKIPRK